MNFRTEGSTRDQLEPWCEWLGALARRRFEAGQPTKLMNSDLAWQLTGSDPKRNIRFWYAGNELVAYGWFQPPVNLIFDCLESVVGAVVPEIIDWATDRREEFPNGTTLYCYSVQMQDEWVAVLCPQRSTFAFAKLYNFFIDETRSVYTEYTLPTHMLPQE